VVKQYHGTTLGHFLINEGLVPPNARDVDLIISATGPVLLRYEVLVDTADLGKLARAIARLAAEAEDNPEPFDPRDNDRPAGGRA
jgi:hypothetical protein